MSNFARIIRRNRWRRSRFGVWQVYVREVEGRGWRRRGIFRY